MSKYTKKFSRNLRKKSRKHRKSKRSRRSRKQYYKGGRDGRSVVFGMRARDRNSDWRKRSITEAKQKKQKGTPQWYDRPWNAITELFSSKKSSLSTLEPGESSLARLGRAKRAAINTGLRL